MSNPLHKKYEGYGGGRTKMYSCVCEEFSGHAGKNFCFDAPMIFHFRIEFMFEGMGYNREGIRLFEGISEEEIINYSRMINCVNALFEPFYHLCALFIDIDNGTHLTDMIIKLASMFSDNSFYQ